MCRESFSQIGQLLKDAVGTHGGALVATPDEIREYLRKEGQDYWLTTGQRGLTPSAVERYALVLRTVGLATCPHPEFPSGEVVVLRDTRRYPQLGDTPLDIHMTPDRMRSCVWGLRP